MSDYEYHDDEHQDADAFYDDGAGWNGFFRDQLRHTPWWAISLSLHLFVLLVIMPMIECQRPQLLPPIHVDARMDTVEEEPIAEKEKEVVDKPLRNELPSVKDPVESDVPPSDHNETADEEETAEARGREEAKSTAQMNHNETLDLIGPGGGAGGTFGGRRGGKFNLARRGGGDVGTEGAVLLGLIWLSKHQDENGKWDGDGFMKHDPPHDVCTGAAKMGWVDPGLTGMATLAFLGAGHTHRYGRFKKTVKGAVRYMMKIQSADGLVGGKRGHYLYNHSICALALAEAYGMTKSPLVKGAAQKAVEYLVKARNPGMAWRYGERDGDNDVSVTGWCVMALKSAKAAELKVEGLEEAMKQAGAYIESVTDDNYWVTGYKSRPPQGWQQPTSSRFRNDEMGVNTANTHKPNHTPTAIATMCRVFFGYRKNDPRLRGGANVLSQMLPVHDTGGGGKGSLVDYYYWYYATLAMFQMGGEYWRQWNKHMKRALVDHQRRKGAARGSWDPIDAWGFSGGRVYATAINVLSLEIYYRYSRVFH